MTDEPILLLDVDGVLANFVAGALKSLKDLFDIAGTHDDVVDWHFETCFNLDDAQLAKLMHAWKQPGWCAALPVYDGAREAVVALHQHAVVHPLTAPFDSQTWVMERDAWLLEHFGFPRKEIVQTEAKHLVKGDVFVDDKPEHVINWQRAHPSGVAVLWARPYNRTAAWRGLRTNDWAEVISIVKAMRWIRRSEA